VASEQEAAAGGAPTQEAAAGGASEQEAAPGTVALVAPGIVRTTPAQDFRAAAPRPNVYALILFYVFLFIQKF